MEAKERVEKREEDRLAMAQRGDYFIFIIK